MTSTKSPSFPVLIVDDEEFIAESYKLSLWSNGIHNVEVCTDSMQVMAFLDSTKVSILLLDLIMPGIRGEQLLSKIRQRHPQIPVVVITGVDDVETAVRCMKCGAFDYLVKPVEELQMVQVVRHAIELREEREEYREFRQKIFNDDLLHPEAFSDIVTNHKSMRSVFQYIEAIARTSKPVLVTGESGVGKELIAKAISTLSQKKGAFVPVNVAGLDDHFFSDTLFGHLKGAFTSASDRRQGLIERATDGTLFLDEIGDLSPASQVKLLRLLEEGEYLSVGADVPRQTNARIIAATNRDLQELQEKGEFRLDLYFRLQTHHIHIPALRERLSDLPLLVDHFLEEGAEVLEKSKPTPPKELYSLLASYHFPGNVRELRSIVFDALSRHTSKMLSMDVFKEHISKHRGKNAQAPAAQDEGVSSFALFPRLPTLQESRQQLIAEAMKRSKGNKVAAASILGITRSGLDKLLRRSQEKEPGA